MVLTNKKDNRLARYRKISGNEKGVGGNERGCSIRKKTTYAEAKDRRDIATLAMQQQALGYDEETILEKEGREVDDEMQQRNGVGMQEQMEQF